MRIIIDINHPAHVHYFRNFSKIMSQNGHNIFFVSRNKEMAHRLLELYGFTYEDRGKGKSGKIGKILYLIYADFKLFQIARKLKPDLFLNFLHPYPSQVARLLGKPSLVFSDTEHAHLHHKLTLPFATKIFTPSCYRISLGDKQVRFNGYMELAYLHPRYFKPDPQIFSLLGIGENEKFVLIRFVSWEAAHDFGHTGMSLQNKIKAVRSMEPFARVFITSEGKLPEDLQLYQIRIPFDRMHDALFYSSLLFGESATMASEAAVLGTPAIFIDNDGRGYTDEQEKRYGLVYNYSESQQDQAEAIAKAVQILSNPESKKEYVNKRENLLANCIDTTQFMLDEVMAS
jgi:predicted glycosyltransferase